MNLNKVFIIGNLTRDPELKTIPSGTSVTSFGVATNRVWMDKQGQKQEDTQFHNIVVFGRQADTVAQYLKKGSSALIEGRIQTRSWDGQDGQKKYKTEIVAERVQFGPRRGGVSQGAPAQGSAPAKASDDVQTIEYPSEDVNPEEIPF